MKLFSTYDIAASSLIAHGINNEIIANNIANSESFIKDKKGIRHPYTAKISVFKFLPLKKNEKNIGGVYISKIIENKTPYNVIYQPNHIFANKKGFVESSNVNILNETIANMDSTQNYRTSLDILNTIKILILKTLSLYEI
nr:hypothetical protein [Buchnera aphidicola]